MTNQRQTNRSDYREATAEEIEHYRERFASTAVTDDVSTSNPRYWNPDWFGLADDLHKSGSHWGTMLSLLAKAWLKSGCDLSRSDMETLQNELDCHMGGYLSRKYSRSELNRAIKDAMRQVGSFAPPPKHPTNRELHAALDKLKRKKR